MRDFLIIGGGVLGLLASRVLSQEGCSVTLLEAGEIGQESSWAGGGILAPLRPWEEPTSVLDLWRWSRPHFAPLAQDLLDATGIDPELCPDGLLYLLPPHDLARALTWAESFGLATETRDTGAAPSGHAALRLPAIGHVRNPRLLRALHASLAQTPNVRIREHCPVREIQVTNGQVRHVLLADGATLGADRYLLTAGAWSGGLADRLPPPLPSVHPIKGQMLALRARPGLLGQIIYCDGRYLIPRRDGVILVGSTVEDTGFDKQPTPQARAELHAFARRIVPELHGAEVLRHWAGLRPAAPGGIPYISIHPTVTNLAFCCGQYRNGLATSPASARLMADLLLGQTPTLAPAPYALDAPRPASRC